MQIADVNGYYSTTFSPPITNNWYKVKSHFKKKKKKKPIKENKLNHFNIVDS
jgi:hypothetical protein